MRNDVDGIKTRSTLKLGGDLFQTFPLAIKDKNLNRLRQFGDQRLVVGYPGIDKYNVCWHLKPILHIRA